MEYEPNELTARVLRDSEQGKNLKSFATVEELFKDLEIEDDEDER